LLWAWRGLFGHRTILHEIVLYNTVILGSPQAAILLQKKFRVNFFPGAPPETGSQARHFVPNPIATFKPRDRDSEAQRESEPAGLHEKSPKGEFAVLEAPFGDIE